MSVELKNKKVRVMSAKITQPHTDRPRPFSGITSQTYTRKQLIQNVYVGQAMQPTRIVSARSHQNKYISAGIEEEKVHYRPVTRQSRQKQQMAEQISALKQTINRLVEQLSHERAKVQNMRKKNTKFQKILTLQFQDDKQWTSNKVSNHLVSGIKTMYEAVKEKYEQKCKEYAALISKIEATDIIEYQIYIKTLEDINNDLSFKLKTYENQANVMALPNQSQKHAIEFVIAQLMIQKEKLNGKLKQFEMKLKKANQSNKQMNMKVEFLQKLIIQKDNNIYALQRKTKKSLADLQKTKTENDITNKQLNELKETYQNEKQYYKKSINDLQSSHQQALETLKTEKEYKIGILQTNNAYVQEMLTQIRKTNNQLNRQLQEIKYLNSKNIKNQKQEQIEVTNKNVLQKNKEEQLKKVININLNSKGERMPQKADKRHREQAVKKRKIQQNQILQISELIKYKLLIQRISIDQLKKMFDFNHEHVDRDISDWQQKYITMKEVITILRSRYLNLKEQDAILLSRYLIEDVQAEYVYCDELNQNHRQVVKSIMKTLIHQYTLHQGKQIEKQAEVVLKNYINSMKEMFKILAPNGLITKTKFYEVLTTLGVDTSTDIKQYLIAKMALHAQGLNSLPIRRIFDQI